MTAIDIHLIQPPAPTSPVMVPHPYSGIIDGALSANVTIGGAAAATRDSTATNTPPHIPIGGGFVNPPDNKSKITNGSASVTINGKAAARAGDAAQTCTDAPGPVPGIVVAVGAVTIGG